MSAVILRRQHIDLDGRITESKASVGGERVQMAIKEPGRDWRIPRVRGDIWAAIDVYPELVTIGTGATRIDWAGIDDQQILSRIVVAEAIRGDLEEAAWTPEVRAVAEEILDLECTDWFDDIEPGDCRRTTRWVSLNGNPATAVVRGNSASVIVRDFENRLQTPYLDPVFKWSFQRLPDS